LQPYFIWNGIDSRSMGVVVTAYPPIIRAKERVTQVTIPGRAGTMTMLEGDAVYDGYIKTIRIGNRPTAALQPIISWLHGAGELILGNEPNMAYTGRIINQISFTKLFPGTWQADVQIWVEPFKHSAIPEPAISVSQTDVLYNPGDVASFPRITLTGTGTGTLVLAGVAMTFEDVNEGIIVDCEAQLATDLAGQNLLTYKCTGDYPIIPVRYSQVVWDGNFSSVSIVPRWRWL
jgi:phage-related protein